MTRPTSTTIGPRWGNHTARREGGHLFLYMSFRGHALASGEKDLPAAKQAVVLIDQTTGSGYLQKEGRAGVLCPIFGIFLVWCRRPMNVPAAPRRRFLPRDGCGCWSLLFFGRNGFYNELKNVVCYWLCSCDAGARRRGGRDGNEEEGSLSAHRHHHRQNNSSQLRISYFFNYWLQASIYISIPTNILPSCLPTYFFCACSVAWVGCEEDEGTGRISAFTSAFYLKPPSHSICTPLRREADA
ncbi:hypothetical protein F5883DRAFT_1766 [Diaporthe sp. PMI_573]|nr:hypothetical protein F5883DRAFT_1766 [Diaporthaceae sp. PMI_573]